MLVNKVELITLCYELELVVTFFSDDEQFQVIHVAVHKLSATRSSHNHSSVTPCRHANSLLTSYRFQFTTYCVSIRTTYSRLEHFDFV